MDDYKIEQGTCKFAKLETETVGYWDLGGFLYSNIHQTNRASN